jgi:hypothetical protein
MKQSITEIEFLCASPDPEYGDFQQTLDKHQALAQRATGLPGVLVYRKMAGDTHVCIALAKDAEAEERILRAAWALGLDTDIIDRESAAWGQHVAGLSEGVSGDRAAFLGILKQK